MKDISRGTARKSLDVKETMMNRIAAENLLPAKTEKISP